MADEALVFCRYLCGHIPSSGIRERYEALVRSAGFNDDSLTRRALKNPMLLPLLDAGAAFFRRNSILRKKLHLMISVLESTKEYSGLFMPSNDRNRGFFFLFITGIWAGIKTLTAGLILLFL